MTLTAMYPDGGLAKGHEVLLLNCPQFLPVNFPVIRTTERAIITTHYY